MDFAVGSTRPIVTRLILAGVDGPGQAVVEGVGIKTISGSEKSPTAEVYSNKESFEGGSRYFSIS